MDAKELRIGNYVIYQGQIQEIRGILKVFSDVKNVKTGNPDVAGHCVLEPIPLTPELLEKCGFKYDGGYYVKGVLFSTLQQDDSEHIFIGTPGSGVATNARCLHQLQNLIHALTGEELTVNLSK